MRAKWCMLVCLLLIALVAVGCAPAKVAPQTQVLAGYRSLRIVGSSLGGVTTTAALAFATVLNKYYPEVEWTSSSGSTGTNPILITKDTIRLGAGLKSAYIQSYGFDKIPESRLRSVSVMYRPSESVFLVPEGKPWKDITQVPKGLTMAPGAPGTATYVRCEVWLQLAGLTMKDFNSVPLGKSEMSDAWRAGKLDLMFAGLSGVAPYLLELQTGPRKFQPMGLSPEQVAKAKAERTFERVGAESPAKTTLTGMMPEIFTYEVYGVTESNVVACRDDFPEPMAYRMARVLDENHSELVRFYPPTSYATPQYLLEYGKPPYDIHPGVVRYYREKGYLK